MSYLNAYMTELCNRIRHAIEKAEPGQIVALSIPDVSLFKILGHTYEWQRYGKDDGTMIETTLKNVAKRAIPDVQEIEVKRNEFAQAFYIYVKVPWRPPVIPLFSHEDGDNMFTPMTVTATNIVYSTTANTVTFNHSQARNYDSTVMVPIPPKITAEAPPKPKRHFNFPGMTDDGSKESN